VRSRFDDAYNCLISTRYTASATPTVATEKLADHADAWLGWTLTNTPTSSSTVPIQSEMPGFRARGEWSLRSRAETRRTAQRGNRIPLVKEFLCPGSKGWLPSKM